MSEYDLLSDALQHTDSSFFFGQDSTKLEASMLGARMLGARMLEKIKLGARTGTLESGTWGPGS